MLVGVWIWVGGIDGYGKLSRQWGDWYGCGDYGWCQRVFVVVRNREKYTTKSLSQTVPYHPCNSSDGALRAFAIWPIHTTHWIGALSFHQPVGDIEITQPESLLFDHPGSLTCHHLKLVLGFSRPLPNTSHSSPCPSSWASSPTLGTPSSFPV